MLSLLELLMTQQMKQREIIKILKETQNFKSQKSRASCFYFNFFFLLFLPQNTFYNLTTMFNSISFQPFFNCSITIQNTMKKIFTKESLTELSHFWEGQNGSLIMKVEQN